ncbi:MAG: hypothetical protein AAGE52_01930 [Myxococcota bacterium]
MTDNLTVPTHFGDLSELSAGLADRVDEERIILYGPNAFEEGSTVSFAVLLIDGTPALEGTGRVAAAVDGGDARAPETRFDIVFDMLQLEGRSEVVYERIVLARQSMMGEEPQTGEVDVTELEAESAEAPEEAPAELEVDTAYAEEQGEYVGEEEVSFASEAPAAAEEFVESADPVPVEGELEVADVGEVELEGEFDAPPEYPEAGETVVASLEEFEEVDPPSLPEEPEGFALPPLPDALTRPMHPPTWWPAEVPPPQPRASSGHFRYGGELPVPAGPPRPELDPSMRVAPAPRPGAEAAPNMPPRDEEAFVEDAAAEEAPALEDAVAEEVAVDEELEAAHDVEADGLEVAEGEADEADVPVGDFAVESDADASAEDFEIGFEDDPVAYAGEEPVLQAEADPVEER